MQPENDISKRFKEIIINLTEENIRLQGKLLEREEENSILRIKIKELENNTKMKKMLDDI
jgi:hypothetical protein